MKKKKCSPKSENAHSIRFDRRKAVKAKFVPWKWCIKFGQSPNKFYHKEFPANKQTLLFFGIVEFKCIKNILIYSLQRKRGTRSAIPQVCVCHCVISLSLSVHCHCPSPNNNRALARAVGPQFVCVWRVAGTCLGWTGTYLDCVGLGQFIQFNCLSVVWWSKSSRNAKNNCSNQEFNSDVLLRLNACYILYNIEYLHNIT